MTSSIWKAVAIALILDVSSASIAGAQDAGGRDRDDAADQATIEVHDVSIWVGDPALTSWNAVRTSRNAMPSMVGTSRPRFDEKETADLFPIAPISFTQFFGEPFRDLDVDLKTTKGSFLAHWPIGKENSGRIRWFNSDLSRDPPADIPVSYLPSEADLFVRLRALPQALYLRNETRFERFLAYDVEAALTVPVRLRGGPDEYTLHNMTNRRLLDVAVIAPSDAGFRIGWLDELPAAVDVDEESKVAEKKDGAKPSTPVDPAAKVDELFDAPEKNAAPKPDDKPAPLPAEGDAEIRARVDQFLNRPITAVVESAPRRELLALVSSESRLRFEYDEKALEKDKVDLTKPTSLKRAEVPARDVLADLLGDVGLSYRITEEGRLYITTAARLAEAAETGGAALEGPPVKVGMSQPLKADDLSYAEFSRAALLRRLEGRGLRKELAELVLDQYAKDLFEPGELLVLAQLSREAIDEVVPLDVFPPPKSLTRVALVVIHGIDPRLQDRARELIRQLGDDSWKERDAAEARLLALGSAAVPALEEALRDKDVEVVYRVERVLLKLNRKVP